MWTKKIVILDTKFRNQTILWILMSIDKMYCLCKCAHTKQSYLQEPNSSQEATMCQQTSGSVIDHHWKWIKRIKNCKSRWVPEEKTVEKMRWSYGQEARSQISFGCENKPSHMSSVPPDDSLIKCTWERSQSIRSRSKSNTPTKKSAEIKTKPRFLLLDWECLWWNWCDLYLPWHPRCIWPEHE